MSFINILLALLVFSAIIIFHEFGHFIVARANKVGVIEFSLGMGPRIISVAYDGNKRKVLLFKSGAWFEKHKEYEGHTVYSWKILPFGGSCIMVGEEEAVKSENSFSEKSVYARMAIVFAGPLFNFILAFVLALIIIASTGYDPAIITDIEPSSPMASSGIQKGDTITAIDKNAIVVNRELGYYFFFNPMNEGKSVEITVDRDGKEKVFSVMPYKEKADDGTESLKLGFYHNAPRVKSGIADTLYYSAYEVKFWIKITLQSLGKLITGQVGLRDMSGPVGIVKTVGDVVEQSRPDGISTVVLNLMMMAILLTANLGVMNLLPIPALDGGRLLFYIIECIRRKPMPEKVEVYFNVGGFALLMVLMVVIMVSDVLKLI